MKGYREVDPNHWQKFLNLLVCTVLFAIVVILIYYNFHLDELEVVK